MLQEPHTKGGKTRVASHFLNAGARFVNAGAYVLDASAYCLDAGAGLMHTVYDQHSGASY